MIRILVRTKSGELKEVDATAITTATPSKVVASDGCSTGKGISSSSASSGGRRSRGRSAAKSVNEHRRNRSRSRRGGKRERKPHHHRPTGGGCSTDGDASLTSKESSSVDGDSDSGHSLGSDGDGGWELRYSNHGNSDTGDADVGRVRRLDSFGDRRCPPGRTQSDSIVPSRSSRQTSSSRVRHHYGTPKRSNSDQSGLPRPMHTKHFQQSPTAEQHNDIFDSPRRASRNKAFTSSRDRQSQRQREQVAQSPLFCNVSLPSPGFVSYSSQDGVECSGCPSTRSGEEYQPVDRRAMDIFQNNDTDSLPHHRKAEASIKESSREECQHQRIAGETKGSEHGSRNNGDDDTTSVGNIESFELNLDHSYFDDSILTMSSHEGSWIEGGRSYSRSPVPLCSDYFKESTNSSKSGGYGEDATATVSTQGREPAPSLSTLDEATTEGITISARENAFGMDSRKAESKKENEKPASILRHRGRPPASSDRQPDESGHKQKEATVTRASAGPSHSNVSASIDDNNPQPEQQKKNPVTTFDNNPQPEQEKKKPVSILRRRSGAVPTADEAGCEMTAKEDKGSNTYGGGDRTQNKKPVSILRRKNFNPSPEKSGFSQENETCAAMPEAPESPGGQNVESTANRGKGMSNILRRRDRSKSRDDKSGSRSAKSNKSETADAESKSVSHRRDRDHNPTKDDTGKRKSSSSILRRRNSKTCTPDESERTSGFCKIADPSKPHTKSSHRSKDSSSSKQKKEKGDFSLSTPRKSLKTKTESGSLIPPPPVLDQEKQDNEAVRAIGRRKDKKELTRTKVSTTRCSRRCEEDKKSKSKKSYDSDSSEPSSSDDTGFEPSLADRRKIAVKPHGAKKIAEAQQKDPVLSQLAAGRGKEMGMGEFQVDGVNLIFFDNRVYIPPDMRQKTLEFYRNRYPRSALHFLERSCFWVDMKQDTELFMKTSRYGAIKFEVDGEPRKTTKLKAPSPDWESKISAYKKPVVRC